MTATYDPAYLAGQLKFLRSHHRLTQANVADLTGLTTRTIEKLESGRHSPNTQTMLSMCRGFGIDESYFRKPSPEEEAETRRRIENATRKTLVVPLTAAVSVRSIMGVMDGFQGLRTDYSAVAEEDVRENAAALLQLIFEWSEVWDDIDLAERERAMGGVYSEAKALEAAGYRLHLGTYRQVNPSYRPPLELRCGLAVVLTTKDHGETRHALVTLEDPWEAHPNDRLSLGQRGS